MKNKMSVVHVIAYCLSCGWQTEDYIYGRRKAAQHAKGFCHRVSVEVGYAYTITPSAPGAERGGK